MNLHEMNGATLGKLLGVEIPDIYVVVAKHSVMGMEAEQIRSLLGATTEEILEVESDDTYKLVRNVVAGAYAEQTANQSTGWDAIENIAMTQLLKRLPFEKDSEFLLRAAAVANKATRKHSQETGVLDPSKVAGRVQVTLTQRLVRQLSRNGETVTETKELSIHDGSMANPSFDEVDSLLSVKNIPVMPKTLEVSTRNLDPTMDELMDEMNRRNH